MAPRKPPRPTDAEMAILRVVWERGPSTVRQIHDVLGETRAIGYTTVLKLLQIMTEKGLVKRDTTQRTHVYAAKRSEQETLRQVVRHLLDRAFGGSVPKLVLHALETKRASREELAGIRRLLDDWERGRYDHS